MKVILLLVVLPIVLSEMAINLILVHLCIRACPLVRLINPLRQVLDAIEEDIEWANYDVWGCRLPEGDFDAYVGADHFAQVLTKLRGEEAVTQWRKLQAQMKPLADAVNALPPLAMRFDLGAAISMGQYLPNTLGHLPNILQDDWPF